MDRGKFELLVVRIAPLAFFRFQVGNQGQLGQEGIHGCISPRKNNQLLQIFQPEPVIAVTLFKVLTVTSRHQFSNSPLQRRSDFSRSIVVARTELGQSPPLSRGSAGLITCRAAARPVFFFSSALLYGALAVIFGLDALPWFHGRFPQRLSIRTSLLKEISSWGLLAHLR